MIQSILTGWGRSITGLSQIQKPNSTDLKNIFERKTSILARGLGRSYGDASQNSGGITLLTENLSTMNMKDGILHVEAGATIESIIRRFVPEGWFIPVTPGTRFVTIGGAIAADVHGKNHQKVGTFGAHVISLKISTPIGIYECSRTDRQDLFWATIGGMGLTGIIISAQIRMLRVETAKMKASIYKIRNIENTMKKMLELDEKFMYSVAWIDTLSKGRKLGRSIITVGNHAEKSDLKKTELTNPLRIELNQKLSAPNWVPNGLLNKFTVKFFNCFWYHKQLRNQIDKIQTISSFFYPLDGIKEWNKIYGSNGFLQYQFVITEKDYKLITEVISIFSRLDCPIFLAVLKKFGSENNGLLSFPIRGWTLALDIPISFPNLTQILDIIDDKVLAVNGKVYLAKDSRMNPKIFKQMYPRIKEFKEIKKKYDPQSIFMSDLSRRLSI